MPGSFRGFLLLSLALCCVARRGETDVSTEGANPIRKVVTLLQDMQKEIEVEGAKEQELYDKFMCFCNGGTADLQKTSADSQATVDSLTAKSEEMTAEKSGLEEELVKHKSELAQAEQDLDKAMAVRSKEKETFDDEYANKKSATTALSGAIPALEKGMGGSSLVQMGSGDALGAIKHALQSSDKITEADRKNVLAFIATQTGGKYAPASGQIVGILKSINDDMLKSMEEMSTTESEAVKGFADLKDSKSKEIQYTKESIEKKTARVGTLSVEIVQAADGIEDAAAEKKNADKFLASLSEQCAAKTKEWEERSKMRADEVSAISEAISILNADDALDVFKKTGLVQKPAAGQHQYGFLQSGRAPGVMRLKKAERDIRSASAFYRSPALSFLLFTMQTQLRRAGHNTAGKTTQAVDFGAIVKMIDGMIVVLEKQQDDDTKHKEWCTTELAKAEDDANSAHDEINSLDATIASISDEISSAADDIASLKESIATLDKDVTEATEMRKKEHAEYLENTELTNAAIELMGKARNRLQKFYNPALYVEPPTTPAPAMLLQVEAHHESRATRVAPPEAPETFGAYEKNKKSGGVLELMMMLANELKAGLAEAQHEEKTAQAEYLELMTESQATREQDNKSLTDKSATKAMLEGKLTSTKESKHMTLEELDNLGKYMEQLHGSCDFILDNFKLRQDARTNELESLKNAKAILSGANYA